jgi:EpsI family protein
VAKKTFLIFLGLVVATFAFCAVVKYYRPEPAHGVELSQFPLRHGEWVAEQLPIAAGVVDILRPDAIFNAIYSNPQGDQVDLFFSYFAGENTQGGVHSPRNCMPGSGWVILKTEPRSIPIGNGVIPASRLYVKYGQALRVVDYWYITSHGETANDYTLKFYTMVSALQFKPTDVAFVRFVSPADSTSLAQLDQFEQEMSQQVYTLLPFDPPISN